VLEGRSFQNVGEGGGDGVVVRTLRGEGGLDILEERCGRVGNLVLGDSRPDIINLFEECSLFLAPEIMEQ
jgi:hypothetical protein